MDQSLIAHLNFIGSNGRGTATSNAPIGMPATIIFYVVSPAHFRESQAIPTPGMATPMCFSLTTRSGFRAAGVVILMILAVLASLPGAQQSSPALPLAPGAK